MDNIKYTVYVIVNIQKGAILDKPIKGYCETLGNVMNDSNPLIY